MTNTTNLTAAMMGFTATELATLRSALVGYAAHTLPRAAGVTADELAAERARVAALATRLAHAAADAELALAASLDLF